MVKTVLDYFNDFPAISWMCGIVFFIILKAEVDCGSAAIFS